MARKDPSKDWPKGHEEEIPEINVINWCAHMFKIYGFLVSGIRRTNISLLRTGLQKVKLQASILDIDSI